MTKIKNSITVLIVEDREINRKLLKAQLQPLRCKIIESADGVQALDMLEHEEIDIVISDILMPNMDGYRLCQAVRASEKFCNLPFIFCTSTHTSEEDEKIARELGADDFIPRPVSAQVVIDAIEKALAAPVIRHASVKTLLDADVMSQYSEILVAKLEQKNAELTELATRLVESENASRVVRDQLQVLFDSFDEIFFIFDVASGTLTQISSSCVRLYGYKAEAFYANRFLWRDLIFREDLEHVDEVYSGLINGKTQEWEQRIVSADKLVKWIYAKAKPILDQNGKTIKIEGYVSDITEKKMLQSELEQTRKLESLGTLAAGIAHDFNNLLAVIMANASLLLENSSDAERRNAGLEVILQTTQRGAALIRQLLTFARKEQPVFEAVALNQFLKEILSLIQTTFPKNINIDDRIGYETLTILGDVNQLSQVFINLCANCRDAMPFGGTITFETNIIDGKSVEMTHPSAEATISYVAVSVQDNGAGMNEATKNRLFEPFFTTKPKNKGTGLGLASVFSILTSHKGFIDVTTALGVGTTFVVKLPLLESGDAVIPIKAINPFQETTHTETILVVDDEVNLREAIAELLRHQGYTVLVAEDGRVALELYEKQGATIDAVISDIDMPEMKGQELFLQIMALNHRAKVILTSGFLNPIYVAELMAQGLKSFIQKPCPKEELLLCLRQVLDAS